MKKHQTRIVEVADFRHGANVYRYSAHCVCGWSSLSHGAKSSANYMAADHIQEMWAEKQRGVVDTSANM